MQTIKTTQTATEIAVQFPYALREAFRAIFKTCPWDSDKRAYLLKNTTANRNKLARFVTESEPALQALTAAEAADATSEELARMRERLAAARQQAEAKAAAGVAARAALADLQALLKPVMARVAQAQADLHEAQAERQRTLAPVTELLEQLGVTKAIGRLRALSHRSFLLKEQKVDFDDACQRLRSANAHLAATLGLTLPALTELGQANYNRLDKTRDALARHADLFVGIRPAEQG
ncbi:hypothetical protein MNJPNG_02785 [Cupriavidus oxalaticus]|uniref:hypothetical protein n=1 Tax=Cupriavidus oxalaticus TaxID=96344 RepID=UPI003F74102F